MSTCPNCSESWGELGKCRRHSNIPQLTHMSFGRWLIYKPLFLWSRIVRAVKKWYN